MRTAWSLTVGGLSNPRLAEPSCLVTGIDPETGTEIGGSEDSVYASVAKAVIGAWSVPTTGTILDGKILKKYETVSMKCRIKEFSYSPYRVTITGRA